MSDSLLDRIRTDLNDARRQRDKLRTTVLTTLLSEARNREIEEQRELKPDEVVAVVNKQIKQRRESAEQMRAGGREELAAKEDREAELLAAYMPEQMSEDEVRAIVRDAVEGGADNIGAVMGRIMPRIKGRFDGREANRIVREELG